MKGGDIMKSYQLRNIDQEVWKQIKIVCAESDISIRQFIIDAIVHYLKTFVAWDVTSK